MSLVDWASQGSDQYGVPLQLAVALDYLMAHGEGSSKYLFFVGCQVHISLIVFSLTIYLGIFAAQESPFSIISAGEPVEALIPKAHGKRGSYSI